MNLNCKIFVMMSVFVGFALCSSYAQKGKTAKTVDSTIVSQENLPVPVSKSFKKRFASATDAVWRQIEGNFVVECVAKNIPTEAEFQADGLWLSTTEALDPNSLPSAYAKTVNSYFPKCVINSYKRKTESNKDITAIVGVYEAQNVKKKLETLILLDKAGAIIRTIEAAEPDVPAASEEDNTSDKKKEKLDAKTQKAMNKDKGLENKPIKISENELPSDLLRWVSLRYPDYVYKEILYLEEPDLFEDEGNVYRLKIQRSGVGQAANATIWFTRDGDFLKLEDEFRSEEEIQQAAQNALDAEKSRYDKDDRTAKGKTQAKVEDNKPLITMIDADEVPEQYRTAMKQKYPKAKEVTWGEEVKEENASNYIAYYIDQAGKNEVFFEKTDSVKWLETKTPIADLTKVPASVRSAVENNYPKQEIKQAWNVKSARVKPYVIVDLYNKKDRTTETIEFWQTGKLKTEVAKVEKEEETEKTPIVQKEEKPAKNKPVKEEAEEKQKVEKPVKDKPVKEEVAAKPSKSKEKPQKEEEIPEPVVPIVAPEEYIAAMKLKYPRAKEVTWGEDDEAGWVAFYNDPAGKNEVYFQKNDSVSWLETRTPIADVSRVPFSIQTIVEKEYPKQVSIKRAWNVKSAIVKPYIIIELYNKKDKSTETREFWQTGKPKN